MGVPACIDPMWSTAGKVIGATIVELMTTRPRSRAAQAEFRERTGGIGGTEDAAAAPGIFRRQWTTVGRNTSRPCVARNGRYRPGKGKRVMGIISEPEYRYNMMIKDVCLAAGAAVRGGNRSRPSGAGTGVATATSAICAGLMHRPGDELKIVDPAEAA